MRTLLLILTTALLTTLGLIYAWTTNALPQLFSFLPLPNYASNQLSGAQIGAEHGASCTTPWGDVIEHGKAFLSFASETGALAESGCESRTTFCNNGSWSADQEPLAFKSCAFATPQTCTVSGFVFAHGATQEFFTFDATAQTCQSQMRTCTDGEVDGDSEYTYLSCPTSCSAGSMSGTTGTCPTCPCLDTQPEIKQPEVKQSTVPVTPPAATTAPKTIVNTTQIKQVTSSAPVSPSEPNCPAPFGGARWEPGQQGSVYRQAIAPYGSTCEKVSVVCAYGSIRYGTKANAGEVALGLSSTCTVAAPADCDSSCGIVEHGSSVTTYMQSIIPYANGQVCDDIQIRSTCSNGVLSPTAGGACSCQIAAPAACTAPNGQTVAHGNSLTLYEYPQVQAVAGDGSDTCVRQWRTCGNGVWYDRNKAPSSFTFKYSTCSVLPPPNGGGVGGDGVPVTE